MSLGPTWQNRISLGPIIILTSKCFKAIVILPDHCQFISRSLLNCMNQNANFCNSQYNELCCTVTKRKHVHVYYVHYLDCPSGCSCCCGNACQASTHLLRNPPFKIKSFVCPHKYMLQAYMYSCIRQQINQTILKPQLLFFNFSHLLVRTPLKYLRNGFFCTF